MGLKRKTSQLGGHQKKGESVVSKDAAPAESSTKDTMPLDAQRQKSVSSQERPKTARSQPDRPKTADRRRSFSRPRTATSANSAGKQRERDREKEQVGIAMPAQTLEYKTGKDTYNFPTPSPRLHPPRSATTTASSARSPLVGTVDDSPKIGVAIGSPSQGGPQWRRTHTVDQVATKSTARPSPARANTEMPRVLQKAEPEPKKKGSWKNLGGIFGRKPSTKISSTEQLRPPQEWEEQPAAPTRTLHSAVRQPPSNPAWTPSPSTNDRSPLPPGAERSRARSMTRGMARMEARAQADRALFEEKDAQDKQTPRRIRTPSIIPKGSMSPLSGSPAGPRSLEEIFKTMDAATAAAAKRNDSPLSNASGAGCLRLDMDIPDHHMERYSVMFENFLGSSAERRPSIIERRQSKLQKKKSLKRLDETNRKDKDRMEAPQPLQRSATSPHLSKMPSLSIKTGKKVRSPKTSPTTTPAEPPITAIHRPKPVKRSNTAPIQASSPVRQNFSKPRMVIVEPTVVVPPEPSTVRGLSIYSEASLPPTPTSGRASGEDSPLRPPPLPTTTAPVHVDHAADWHVLNANPNSTAIPKRKLSLARQEASLPANPNPYRLSPQDLESRVVQVSVARQVSVSKARSQVRQAVDAKQPLRPRVVELGKNRKSTMVLIEGAEE